MDKGYLLEVDRDTVKTYFTDKRYSHVPPAKMAAFVIKWTRYNQEKREQYFPGLFELIKLREMPHNDLKGLSNDSLVKKFACVAQTVKTSLTSAKKEEETGLTKSVIVVGRGQPFLAPSYNVPLEAWAYIISLKRWIALTCLPEEIQRASLVTDYPDFLAVDTYRPSWDSFFSLHRYSSQEGTWSRENFSFPSNFKGKQQVKKLVRIGNQLFVVVFWTLGEVDSKVKAYMLQVVQRRGAVQRPIEIQVVHKHADVRVFESMGELLLLFKHEKKRNAYLFDPRTYSMTMEAALTRDPKTFDWIFCVGILHYKRSWRTGPCGKFKRTAVIDHKDIYVLGRQKATPGKLSDNSVLVSGTDMPAQMSSALLQQCYRFHSAKYRWISLPDIPVALEDIVAASALLPVRLGSCPRDCLHCLTPYSWRRRVLLVENNFLCHF